MKKKLFKEVFTPTLISLSIVSSFFVSASDSRIIAIIFNDSIEYNYSPDNGGGDGDNGGDGEKDPSCISESELRMAVRNELDLTNLNVSCVKDFSYLFYYDMGPESIESLSDTGHNDYESDRFTYMYGDISNWDVSSGETFEGMFKNNREFNQNISDWDTGKAINFSHMFEGTNNFDQPIGKWDTKKC